jgi:exoribonuclease-2
VAQILRERRHEHGALDLETIEAKAVFDGDMVVDLRSERQNRARQLIEEFMIAANGVAAAFVEEKGFAALRRVVRSPERWAKIVEVAEEFGASLPPEPDSAALEGFLVARRTADPLRFPDLSLTIIKLMGAGEYVVHAPRVAEVGHFGLAVRAYTHSTAPNRRYPDLVVQRLLKAAMAGKPSPYSVAELADLAEHCTTQENGASKVERHVRKSAAAILMGERVGERFDAVVTGASEKGTWVRVFNPPVEGKLVSGAGDLRVGKRLTVKLVRTDVEMGFVDFARA